MNLYNIQTEYLQLMQDIEGQEGVLEEEQIAKLQIIEENFKEKISQYCKMVRQLEADSNFCQIEIDRIKEIQTTKTNLIDRLEKIMLEAIKMFGDKEEKVNSKGSKYFIYRFNIDTFKLFTRRSESLEIPDETIIDNKWKRVNLSNLTMEEGVKVLDLLGKSAEEVKYKTDILKTPIKEAIEKNNEVVKGASIVEKYSLSLK